MSIIIYPTDGREYNADEAAGYFATRTTGVFATEDNFNVTVSGDRSVKIGTGIAWIKDSKLTGRSVINDGDVQLSFSMPDGINDRVDRIVIRYEKEANACYLAVLEGTPSNEPTPPDITRTDFVFELGLYAVLIKGGTTKIDEGDITNTMLDESVCGVMRDGVTGLPTAQIQAQAESLIEDLRNLMEQVAGSEIPDMSIGTEKFTDTAKTPFSGVADSSKNGTYLVNAKYSTLQSVARYLLTDVPEVSNIVEIKFVAPVNYRTDINFPIKFLVNNVEFNAVLQNGDVLPNGFFAKDRIVTASVDFANKVINFKSSGGSLKFAKGSILIGSESVNELTIPTLFKAKYFRFIADISKNDIPINSAENRIYFCANYDEKNAITASNINTTSLSGGRDILNLKGWVSVASNNSFSLTLPYEQYNKYAFAPSTTYYWELWSDE